MKTTHCIRLILALLLAVCWLRPAGAQNKLPPDWQQKTREKYRTLAGKEISLQDFLEVEKAEYFRQQAIQKGTATYYQPQPSASICGNGDFETGINPAEWAGGYGNLNDPTTLTAGFAPGLINLPGTHHTVLPNSSETASTDAITGIPVKHGGSKALRLGNTMPGNGMEVISKTFTVNSASSLVGFWYAVVMQNPTGHAPSIQPKFAVQVKHYPSGTPISGVVDLGNGSNELIADATNPFFYTKNYGGQALVWKDWSCAQINLGAYVGQAVTVEFVMRDCNASPPSNGGHFGYAYLDDFCGLCQGPEGWVSYNVNASNCANGNLCFNYGLPSTGTATGTGQIQLEILQNGAVVTTLSSPVLSSGTQYCFNFPCNSPALNLSLGGFDFVATGIFQIGMTTLPPKYSGTKPDGHLAGQNNDCQCAGPKPAGLFCCEGVNLVKNPCFESGATGFASQYALQNTIGANSILPGQYTVADGLQAAAVCQQWQVKDHTGCTNPGNSKMLLVNGETTQTANAGNVVWEQTVGGLEVGASYKFCAYMKNLPACCFDVVPRVKVEITPGASSAWTPVSAGPAPCDWQLVELTFTATAGSVTIKIYLEETGKGDGNDLAIDDISLQKVPAANVQITVQNQSLNATSCQLTASLNALSNGDDALPGKDCKYVWVVGKMSTLSPPAFSGMPSFGGDMGDPSWGLTTTFPGFNCATNQPYLVYLYVYDCDCQATGFDYQVTMDNGRVQKLGKADEKALHQLVQRLIRERRK